LKQVICSGLTKPIVFTTLHQRNLILPVDTGVGYFLPDSREKISEALDRAIKNGVGYDLELETLTTKGRKIDVRTTAVVTQKNDIPVRLTGIFQDISGQKAIQRKLEMSNTNLQEANTALQLSAHYDPLTALPNRILLSERMQQAMTRNVQHSQSVEIVFIDLDGFKAIKDSYGHSVGDQFLRKISSLLKGSLREGDTLARIGGDEFVAVMDEFKDPQDSHASLTRILQSVATELVINGKLLKVSASIGVTYYPQDNSSPDQLLRHADQAVYKAKQLGKNRWHIFDIEEDVAVKHKHEELERLRLVLKNEEFTLFYQPKIDLRSKEVIGLEALIRWVHPEQGVLAPAAFLPVLGRMF
jgi:diguanylate cyclase (GGDEF)-like protein